MIGLRDLDLDVIIAAMPTYTEAGAVALRDRLSTPLTDAAAIGARQAEIRSIQSVCKSHAAHIATLRTTLRDAEEDVLSVVNAATDTRHAEYYTQLLWSSTSQFAWLNNLGWLTELIVFFRTIFLPAISMLLPVILFVAPLIFYSAILREPMTVKGYFQIIHTSLKKTMPSVLGAPRFEGKGSFLEFGEQFAHIGVSLAMLVASIWNQISSAISLRAVVADMRRRADAVTTFARTAAELAIILELPATVLTFPDRQLGLFGSVWNSADSVRTLVQQVGHLDMLVAIASAKRTCFPTLGPTLAITDLYHPGLQKEKRIYNSIEMGGDKKTHVLLTGPNRGGKSTLLKALGSAVLMTHTVGIVFGRRASVPVFDNIISALSPQDVVGKLSLFEAEIEFAKQVRGLMKTGRTFLMMDEIFHGTNAHDGVEASQVFLEELYGTGVYSVVSTHYMDLPARFNAQVQTLCMDASIDPADPDRLIYTYRLKEGVNKYSSVREILRERGLLRSPSEKNKRPSQ